MYNVHTPYSPIILVEKKANICKKKTWMKEKKIPLLQLKIWLCKKKTKLVEKTQIGDLKNKRKKIMYTYNIYTYIFQPKSAESLNS